MIYLYITLVSLFFNPDFIQAESMKETLFKEASEGHRSFSYEEARIKLFNEIYLQNNLNGYFIEGVYCQEKHYPFSGQHPNGRVPNPRIFNTEHTWPQSKFSTRFSKDEQKSDLHHLYPTFSKINSERGSLPFADVNSRRELSCDESLSGSPVRGGRGNYFEPPQEHKGNVARAMFYFSVRYQISIDPVQELYLRLWHEEDPSDEMERIHHERIYQLQGNRNPFIDDATLVNLINDF